MVASLASLPPSTATLAALGYVLPLLPESSTVVLLSAAPKEAVDMTLLSYIVKDTHVVHLFDHWSSVGEAGHALEPYPEPLSSTTPSQESLTQTLQKAGYNLFDYHGDPNAETVLVVLNGPLGLTMDLLIWNTYGLGAIAVRILRSWDEDSFSNALPKTARNVHVLEDAPFETALGVLCTY